MSSSLIWAFLDRGQPDAGIVIFTFAASVVICLVLGLSGVLFGRKDNSSEGIYRKEAIAVVGLGWLLCGLLGALPYILSGVLDGIYDNGIDIVVASVFESISGFK